MKKKNVEEMSEEDLAELIAGAQKELKERLTGKRKEVIAQIKALAASIGITVELSAGESGTSRRGTKVAIKYRNPADGAQTWTGRGVKPNWLRQLLEQGKALDEFLV